MIDGPRIAWRDSTPYVAIRAYVTMATIGADLPDLTPEVMAWLDVRGATASGAPIFKYNVIDMLGELEVEVGIPVLSAPEADERIITGVVPAGNFVVARHKGHPRKLEDATAQLLEWGRLRALRWNLTHDDGIERWTARIETYFSNSYDQPDMDQWETEVAILLAD